MNNGIFVCYKKTYIIKRIIKRLFFPDQIVMVHAVIIVSECLSHKQYFIDGELKNIVASK